MTRDFKLRNQSPARALELAAFSRTPDRVTILGSEKRSEERLGERTTLFESKESRQALLRKRTEALFKIYSKRNREEVKDPPFYFRKKQRRNRNENIDVIATEVLKSEDTRNYMLSKEGKRLSYERSSRDIGTEQKINFY